MDKAVSAQTEVDMKETIIAIIVTATFAATLTAAIRHGQQVADLEHAVAVLERELRHNQVMLDDAHRYYPLLERRVLQIETDYTAREVIWMMQDIFADCANVEVY